MSTEIEFKKLYEFAMDLNQVYIYCSNNVEFRSKCLKLLQKHFGYHIMSFNLYGASIKTPDEYKLPNYDNVTMELPKELVSEYYNKYQKQDFITIHAPEKNIRDIFRICDITSYQEYERSNFYQNLYKKYGLYYQVAMSILRDQEAIGYLSILRSKQEGEFSNDEIQFFYPLRDLISRYTVNCLQIEILKLENQALKMYTEIFPIGHIVLDSKYKILYANPTATDNIVHMTGMSLDQFKYYYLNKILPQIDSSPNSNLADTFIELPNYFLRIKREPVEPFNGRLSKDYEISIFIQKKIVANLPTSLEIPMIKELTVREIEIIELIRQGLKNTEIANALQLSEHTVKAHIQRIYGKVGVNNKTSLLHRLTELVD